MPSSLDLAPLFIRPCPSKDGVFDGLDHSELAHDSFANKVKQVEMETFSVRAADFKDEEVLEIPDGENKILNPLRTFPKGSLFLELGGGNGRFGLKLMQDGYHVVESDIAEGSVRKAKEIAERHNISNGGYAVIDAEHLPFKDGTFDAVFMIASFHHLPNASKAVAEIARVLKPSGKLLVLREPASWQYIVLAPLYVVLRKYLRGMNHNHFSLADDVTRGFSPRSFRKLLSPVFPTVTLHPVDYTRKIYTNWLILKMKASKKPYREHPGIIRFLEVCDRGIARIPLLKSFPWDWDVTCER